MKELLQYVTGLIANEKDKVEVTEQKDAVLTKYVIKVGRNDTKAVIGREGKAIKAIRSLISMAAINKNIKKKIPVEIVEE